MPYSRNIVVIGIVTGAALFITAGWLFAQNQAISRQLELNQQLLNTLLNKQGQSVVSEYHSGTDSRMRMLEQSLEELASRLKNQDRNAIEDGPMDNALTNNNDSAFENLDQTVDEYTGPAGPVGFSDTLDNSEQALEANLHATAEPVAERTYKHVHEKITQEGLVPKNAAFVRHGLAQFSLSNEALAQGLLFGEAICSEYRCLVEADISQTTFSTERISNDTEFAAHDNYHLFLLRLQNSIDDAMPNKTQVSLARSGDKVVVNIMPKQPAGDG